MVNKFESGCIYQLPLPRHGDLLQEIEAKVRSLFVNAGRCNLSGQSTRPALAISM